MTHHGLGKCRSVSYPKTIDNIEHDGRNETDTTPKVMLSNIYACILLTIRTSNRVSTTQQINEKYFPLFLSILEYLTKSMCKQSFCIQRMSVVLDQF